MPLLLIVLFGAALTFLITAVITVAFDVIIAVVIGLYASNGRVGERGGRPTRAARLIVPR